MSVPQISAEKEAVAKAPFLRLLLTYHDPELSQHLDRHFPHWAWPREGNVGTSSVEAMTSTSVEHQSGAIRFVCNFHHCDLVLRFVCANLLQCFLEWVLV